MNSREHGYNDAKYGFTYVPSNPEEYCIGAKLYELEKKGMRAGSLIRLNTPIIINSASNPRTYHFAQFADIVQFCKKENDYIVTVKLADGKLQYTYLSECLLIKR